jgi:hypothetical protein
MNGPDARHRDVASYALGILDDADAMRFEEHLADCAMCAMELESLLPVSALMSQVDGDSFVAAEKLVREGRMLDEMVNAVTYDRSRVRARRMFALAAGVVALLLVGALSLVTGTLVGGDDAQPLAGDRSTSPTGTTDPGYGLGGADDPMAGPGEKFTATDAATKVKAEVLLNTMDWGTQVSLRVGSIRGPLTCQLVAVGPNDLGEVLMTWTVPPNGWGTKANPALFFAMGTTAVERSRMDRIEVQSVDKLGNPALLVTIDV